MSNDGVNSSRRTFLIGLTSAIGAAGAVGVAVPFVKSWQPSAKAKNAVAPVKIDISKLEFSKSSGKSPRMPSVGISLNVIFAP